MPSTTQSLATVLLPLLFSSAIATTPQADNIPMVLSNTQNLTYGWSPPSANSICSNNTIRNFGIFIPQSYVDSPSTAHKLIIDYHGNNDDPQDQFLNSMYPNNTLGVDYIIVYPAGLDNSWQSAPYSVGVNDLLFTADLLAHLEDTYTIDVNHIYASGKSNGGGFVDYLACSSVGDQFAAFAMASAALYSDTYFEQCKVTKPRPVLESHGLNDTVIRYNPRKPRHDIMLPNIQTWVGWWAQRDGCAPGTIGNATTVPNEYLHISYSCGNLTNVVQHYDVFNLGHCWPNINGSNFDSTRSFCTDHTLDYTTKVLEFFASWDLTMT